MVNGFCVNYFRVATDATTIRGCYGHKKPGTGAGFLRFA